MTIEEKRLTIVLLQMAGKEFSNHGCGDFDLSEYIVDPNDRDSIVFEAYGELFGSNDSPDYRVQDWALMYTMADRLQDEIRNK